MLLLNRELNASVSNGSFMDKVEEYRSFNVIDINEIWLSYNTVKTQDDWNLEFINKRTSFLASRLSDILKNRRFF